MTTKGDARRAEAPQAAWSFTAGLGRFLAATAACLMASLGAAQAQADNYPSRTITIVTGFAAGGTADIYARLLGDHLKTSLGQPVIVENRPGAATMIGTQFVARARPDGYTLLLGSSAIYTNSFLYSRLPYKTDDLLPVGGLFTGANFLAVPEASPFKSLGELVSFARANPGKLNYGTTGAGGFNHLLHENFTAKTGIKAVAVHYSGAGPMGTAVLKGEVDFNFLSVPAALSQINAGRMRALGVTTAERISSAPAVPTMAEAGRQAGLANFAFVAGSWYGLFAPAGTPQDVVATLNKAIRAFGELPATRERFRTEGNVDNTGFTPEDYAAFIARDTAGWRTVIEPLGIRLD